jgi:cellulose synthase/poly-beta-1,6-N-acetylglucosamine synthase-like glycosyltransferase
VTLVFEVVFWACLGAILWTHAGYPLFMALAARVRPRRVAAADILPTVTFLIPAYNEESVIEAKLRNTLALDYPPELMEIVVASDASTDRTHEIVERYADRGVELLVCPRAGKMPALDRAVRRTTGEIVCVGDANVLWDASAVREMVRPYADPQVGMVTGRVDLVNPNNGTNQEGLYWRYEMWLRTNESRVHSETASNGAIHSIRRSLYRELHPADDHDISFPYSVVQRGFRAVYEPRAHAVENMTTDIEDEYGRKSRFLEHCWLAIFKGTMWKLWRFPPLYAVAIVSHRFLRYLTGLLHLILLAVSIPLAASPGGVYRVALVVQLGGLALALLSIALRGRIPGINVLHYYLLITWATLTSLVRYLHRGVPATWDAAAGTRTAG